MTKKGLRTLYLTLGVLFLFAMSFQAARLSYYNKPRLNIISKKIDIDAYDAKYVHKLYFLEDREYYWNLKIEEITHRSGIFVKVIKRDTLENKIWYREVKK